MDHRDRDRRQHVAMALDRRGQGAEVRGRPVVRVRARNTFQRSTLVPRQIGAATAHPTGDRLQWRRWIRPSATIASSARTAETPARMSPGMSTTNLEEENHPSSASIDPTSCGCSGLGRTVR